MGWALGAAFPAAGRRGRGRAGAADRVLRWVDEMEALVSVRWTGCSGVGWRAVRGRGRPARLFHGGTHLSSRLEGPPRGRRTLGTGAGRSGDPVVDCQRRHQEPWCPEARGGRKDASLDKGPGSLALGKLSVAAAEWSWDCLVNGAARGGTGAESKLVVFEFGEVTEGQGILGPARECVAVWGRWGRGSE